LAIKRQSGRVRGHPIRPWGRTSGLCTRVCVTPLLPRNGRRGFSPPTPSLDLRRRSQASRNPALAGPPHPRACIAQATPARGKTRASSLTVSCLPLEGRQRHPEVTRGTPGARRARQQAVPNALLDAAPPDNTTFLLQRLHGPHSFLPRGTTNPSAAGRLPVPKSRKRTDTVPQTRTSLRVVRNGSVGHSSKTSPTKDPLPVPFLYPRGTTVTSVLP